MTRHLRSRHESGRLWSRWFAVGWLVALGLGPGAQAQSGYLTLVGPSPLRFEAPSKPPPDVAASASLPPVIVPPAPVEASTEAELPPSPAIPFPLLPLEPEVTTAKSPARVDTSEKTLPPAPPFLPEDPNLVAPQMVLPFFRGVRADTNAPAGAVSPPVMFIPPTRVARTPSKATYSTP